MQPLIAFDFVVPQRQSKSESTSLQRQHQPIPDAQCL
eukprot:gene26465-biopygen16568